MYVEYILSHINPKSEADLADVLALLDPLLRRGHVRRAQAEEQRSGAGVEGQVRRRRPARPLRPGAW